MKTLLVVIFSVIALLIPLAVLARKKSYYTDLANSEYSELLPYVIAQAKHETNGYKSRAFIEQNNLFGMKNANKRKQLGVRRLDNQYRQYKSPQESVKDLIVYFDFVKFPKAVIDSLHYAEELKRRKYYGDTIENYNNGLIRWAK
jgi:flagellum-specific peptidoglycan hydrolase FlgJ